MSSSSLLALASHLHMSELVDGLKQLALGLLRVAVVRVYELRVGQLHELHEQALELAAVNVLQILSVLHDVQLAHHVGHGLQVELAAELVLGVPVLVVVVVLAAAGGARVLLVGLPFLRVLVVVLGLGASTTLVLVAVLVLSIIGVVVLVLFARVALVVASSLGVLLGLLLLLIAGGLALVLLLLGWLLELQVIVV